ncbi:MAG: conserved phage C-terminal domain-containing protein [Proteobacteria bacterium]|nr:conserved phage C-terminal domain-containing protein [Pseudomonadota bacterium]
MKQVKAYLLGEDIPSRAVFLYGVLREIKNHITPTNKEIFFYEVPIKEEKKASNRAFENYKDAIDEIITYLNIRTGKRYSSTAKANIELIKPRLLEYSVNDFKRLIDNKCNAWLDNPKMVTYLRPETLFSKKHFESYLNETSPEQVEDDLFNELDSYTNGDA